MLPELACFACPSSPPRPPLRCPSRTIPVRSKDSPAHLTDAQLASLSKCIACGLQWTSKKSAKQKRTHIEQCARKNALTKDTVTFLIQKDALPNHANATLMDSVVPAGPVKKPRRQQVAPTVRSLPETRESILHRARDILEPTSIQEDPLSTQDFGQSAFSDEPQLTQAFGASSLRAGQSRGQSSSHPIRQLGTSMFDQGSVLSSDRKRPASPPLTSGSTPVRRRLQ